MTLGYRILAIFLLVSAIVGSVWIAKDRYDTALLRAENAEKQVKGLNEALESEKKNVKTVTKFVDRVTVIKEKAKTLTKEVTKYVTVQADAACPIPVGFVQLHDAASQGQTLAASAGDPDAPAEGVTLSAIAVTVGDNYYTCHENNEQILALQQWAKDNGFAK